MRWPDIFFRSRKATPEDEPPELVTPPPQAAAPVPVIVGAPTVKAVPAAAQPMPTTPVVPESVGKSPSLQASTRTIPVMRGVVLTPPVRPSNPRLSPSADVPSASAIKNIEQLMAEADPVQTLRQTGSILVMKHSPPEPDEVSNSATPPVPPPPVRSNDVKLPAASGLNRLDPAGAPAAPKEARHNIPAPKPPSSHSRQIVPVEDDSPFILAPTVPNGPVAPTAGVTTPLPPEAPAALMPFGIFRRKARMADVARIVLPPKREEAEPEPALNQPAAAVVPSSFPVNVKSGRLHIDLPEKPEPAKPVVEPSLTVPVIPPVPEKVTVTDIEPQKPALIEKPASEDLPVAKESKEAPLVVEPEVSVPLETPKVEPAMEPEADVRPEEKPVEVVTPPALVPESPTRAPEPAEPKPEVVAEKVEPEVKPETKPEPAPEQPLAPAVPPAEKREFHLANGERVVGVVISETPEAIYLDHSTIGVITIPRAQIAKRLVEIILINGDRIVGDIMAETADTLYVRHSSLGMLTVPRAQRSTRVVEAILKDGDRILGEVLTETPIATVIRSATLGTVTVPHTQLAMLNRKLEQIELKSLPAPVPELKDKPSD